jgi:predicted RNase H-like nuclease (RuvC/YqgF family)
VKSGIFKEEKSMEATQTASHPKDDSHPVDDSHPCFETVWAALKEVAERQKENERQMKENAEQLDRKMKENAEQLDRQMKEADRRKKETDRKMKETDSRLGKLGNRMGEIIEHMVAPNFAGRGIAFRCRGVWVLFIHSP